MIKSILSISLSLFFFLPVFSFTAPFGDYYIDRVTGKQLGSDGSETDNLRVIDRREWDYVIEEKGGVTSIPGIQELHKNSSVISVDEIQIQKEIQRLADDTMKEGLENQVFIVLNVNTGKIFAVRDWIPKLKSSIEIVISTYGVGPNSAPRVGEGLMLLAQLHGHPKEERKNKKNLRSVSRFDVEVAEHLRISIFAIDAFDEYHTFKAKDFKEYSRAFHIHQVTREGLTKNFVGQTFGKNGLRTFDFSTYFFLLLREEDNVSLL